MRNIAKLVERRPAAVFSADRKYRYYLRRRLNTASGAEVCFIMLNPSTADELRDDSTIRRCIGFGRAHGYSSLMVVKLFAFRATEPKHMAAQTDPVGPLNDDFIAEAAGAASEVICAWGVHDALQGRSSIVLRMLSQSGIIQQVLGLTKQNEPKHPLYLPKETKPMQIERSLSRANLRLEGYVEHD